jgi:hypothetical protein
MPGTGSLDFSLVLGQEMTQRRKKLGGMCVIPGVDRSTHIVTHRVTYLALTSWTLVHQPGCEGRQRRCLG